MADYTDVRSYKLIFSYKVEKKIDVHKKCSKFEGSTSASAIALVTTGHHGTIFCVWPVVCCKSTW